MHLQREQSKREEGDRRKMKRRLRRLMQVSCSRRKRKWSRKYGRGREKKLLQMLDVVT